METVLNTDRGEFNIQVYETLSDQFRAYVVGAPNIQAWGNTEKKAKEQLKHKIEIM